jgi:hypothetical protein
MEADVLFVSAASVLLFLIIFLSTNLIRRGPLTSYINIHIEPENKNIDNPIFSRALRRSTFGIGVAGIFKKSMGYRNQIRRGML